MPKRRPGEYDEIQGMISPACAMLVPTLRLRRLSATFVHRMRRRREYTGTERLVVEGKLRRCHTLGKRRFDRGARAAHLTAPVTRFLPWAYAVKGAL